MAQPPPAVVDDGGQRWVRTDICKGSDLVDGTAWIANFQKRLAQIQENVTSAGGEHGLGGTTRSTRLLRQTVSDGDDPQFWGNARDPPNSLRNSVLKQMAQEGKDPSRGCGKRVKLVTGEDVIFWFNVGPPGELRNRVYVTDAHCPHQRVCLNEGELKDIEDIAGQKHGMVRCHRHNKSFDLRTGESPGNQERLPTYQCRFELGHWWVAIGPTPVQAAQAQSCLEGDIQMDSASVGDKSERAAAQESEDVCMDVDPVPKRPRLEEPPTPCRSLGPRMTVA